MREFFIDTADIKYIENTWTKLSSYFFPQDLVGVTSNPSAILKIGVKDIYKLKNTINDICQLISSIRNDNTGVVYVQHPNSNVSPQDLIEYAKRIVDFSDGVTKVGLKIPPFLPILKIIDKLKEITEVNVTGVSDCSTALMCFGYNVDYVSVLIGRMEEKGINVQEQFKYLNQRNKKNGGKIITGSMRTIDGLQRAIEYGSVPTIGTKVFDAIFNENKIEEFANMWNLGSQTEDLKFSPNVNNTMTELSVAFFNQMDDCGKDFKLS